ncbi:MAG: hypothetical protein JWP06_1131 [Candidatus Saccharibacteria bacterium]|nr:hypothetical protein [Candidatus Saccharibacteria bacterium]
MAAERIFRFSHTVIRAYRGVVIGSHQSTTMIVMALLVSVMETHSSVLVSWAMICRSSVLPSADASASVKVRSSTDPRCADNSSALKVAVTSTWPPWMRVSKMRRTDASIVEGSSMLYSRILTPGPFGVVKIYILYHILN